MEWAQGWLLGVEVCIEFFCALQSIIKEDFG
jgi:hypothetical protein